MTIFDSLIDDIAQRFGLGANAAPLVREALTLITGAGGIGGFLNLFKTAGLSSDIASWVGHSNAAPLAGPQLEKVLGGSALGGIASRLGRRRSIGRRKSPLTARRRRSHRRPRSPRAASTFIPPNQRRTTSPL